MIPGITTQGPFKFLPRNVVATPLDVISDDDTFGSANVLSNVDRILGPGFVNDSDAVFACTSSRFLILTPLCVVVADSLFGTMIAARDQLLFPLLHVANDTFKLPAITIPGILQSNRYADDEVIFAPFVLIHGSLRPNLYNVLDTFYAPMVVGARTLLPNSLHVSTDVFYAPIRTTGARSPLVTDADVIYSLITTRPGAAVLVVDVDAIPVSFIGVPVTLDGPIVGSLAMSGGNLTATHTANDTVSGVRSLMIHNSGKYYFEVTITQSVGAYTAVGIGVPGFDYTGMSPGVYAGGGGPIGVNGSSSSYSLSAFTNGDVIGVAVDLNARLAWFRQNNGNWNGNSIANPSTGVNGVTVPAGSMAPLVRFATNSVAGDNLTANFGQAALFAARPTGYGLWMKTIASVAAPVVTDSDTITGSSIGQIISSPMSNDDVIKSPLMTGGVLFATFDGVATNVALSNGGLTATRTATTTSGAKSAAFKTTGKYYFEITVGATHGTNDGQGIITSIGSYDDIAGGGFNGTATNFNGAIYSNNTDSGKTIGAVVSGDNVGIAIDLNARRGWFCRNGGNWNGDPTANPAAGTGGVILEAGASFAPMVVFFGGSSAVINDTMTANFGKLNFVYAQPAGFGVWVA